jgi:hypothetical protein
VWIVGRALATWVTGYPLGVQVHCIAARVLWSLWGVGVGSGSGSSSAGLLVLSTLYNKAVMVRSDKACALGDSCAT